MDNDFEIKLTEEELDVIVQCFESDRAKITEQFGFDADIQLQLFKTYKQQILGNQEVMNRVQEQKNYYLLSKWKYDSGFAMAKYRHALWEELVQIEKGSS